MKKLATAYILEDEQHSRNLLHNLISTHLPMLDIVGEAQTLDKFELDHKSTNFDILFCDIKVKGKNSITYLEQMVGGDFFIIFTTAYSDFAIPAIRLDAIDYLVKPIAPDSLITAVNKAIYELNSERKYELDSRSKELNKLMISEPGGIYFIELDTIVYLKADKTYTEIYTRDGKCHTTSKGLTHFEDLLDKSLFYRIHHSFVVNLKHVVSFNARTLEIRLVEDITLNVSNRKKGDFLKNLEEISYA